MTKDDAINRIEEYLLNQSKALGKKFKEEFDAIECTYSIILGDHENGELFIAEVVTNGDIDRIIKENKKLNEEQRDDDRDWDDYYDELSNRTGLKIYKANVLDI